MANQYSLTNDFAAIVETQGTLYNPSSSNIELASAADTVKGKGIIFPSGATQTFRGTLYARSMDSAATLNVSDFTDAAGGGDRPILRFCGSVLTYDDLPDDAEVGDVYDVQTASPEHGILAGDNVAWTGDTWDKMIGTIEIMTGATASTNGTAGLVPVPEAGKEAKFLRGDATWATEADMTGAAAGAAGAHGLVPAPAAGDNTKFLRGDGAWATEATMTGATSSTAGAAGLVPAPTAGQEAHILMGGGSWALPYGFREPSTAYTAGAYAMNETLSTGLLLRCTTAGTTSSAALDCSSYELGDTITDGTVTWLVEQYVITTDGGTTVLPATTNSVDLGSASRLWRKLYAQSIDSPRFRSPSASYNVGDFCFLSIVEPVKLVCVKAGTSGSGDLTLSSTDEGTIVTDGGAKWAVDSLADGIYTPDHLNGIARGAEIQFTWAELSAKKAAGDFTGLHIGDYKEITLTSGEKVVMELAGISNYKNHGGTAIGNHLDFISRDCLAGGKQWNATATNNGTADEKRPWPASDLYKALNDESTGVFAKLPSDLKSAIIPKRALLEERYSAAGAISEDSSWSWADAGKLWLPTEIEVFGHPVWSEPGYGTGGGGCNKQYPIFMGNSKHLIKGDGNGGSRVNWWLLSVNRANASDVCCVSYNGNADYYSAAGASIRAPLCFRIG